MRSISFKISLMLLNSISGLLIAIACILTSSELAMAQAEMIAIATKAQNAESSISKRISGKAGSLSRILVEELCDRDRLDGTVFVKAGRKSAFSMAVTAQKTLNVASIMPDLGVGLSTGGGNDDEKAGCFTSNFRRRCPKEDARQKERSAKGARSDSVEEALPRAARD